MNPWEGGKNGRAASFLQVSSSTCHHAGRPPLPKRPRNPHSWFRLCNPARASCPLRDKHTLIRALADTITGKFRGEGGGEQFRFLRGPGLPRAARAPSRDPDVTHIMDSRAAGAKGGKLPKSPGDAAGRGGGSGGYRGARALLPRPRLGEAAERTPARRASRRSIYKQCTPLGVGGARAPGRWARAPAPSRAPATRRTRVWGSAAGAGDAHPGGRPSTHSLPARDRNSPGSPRREGDAAHLVFRKSVDRLPEPGRHGAGAPRGLRGAPGRLGCGAGGRSSLLLRARPARVPPGEPPDAGR